jgi:hypothetical protein
LFKIGNLLEGGKEIVMSQYCNLERQRVYGGCSVLAGWPFVSVKINLQTPTFLMYFNVKC